MKCTSFGLDGLWRTRPFRPQRRFPSGAGTKVSVALAVVAAASCGSGEREVGTSVVYDSAGVTIIENPEPDRPLGVEVTPIADLIPPDSALTVVPWGVTTDEATGRIYVADRPNDRVVVFDAAGGYAGTLGRSGDGPGEFRNPVAGAVDPSGSLVVWDSRRRILSRWSSGGGYLGEERPELDYGGFRFVVGTDWFVAVTDTAAGMAIRRQLVVHREGRHHDAAGSHRGDGPDGAQWRVHSGFEAALPHDRLDEPERLHLLSQRTGLSYRQERRRLGGAEFQAAAGSHRGERTRWPSGASSRVRGHTPPSCG